MSKICISPRFFKSCFFSYLITVENCTFYMDPMRGACKLHLSTSGYYTTWLSNILGIWISSLSKMSKNGQFSYFWKINLVIFLLKKSSFKLFLSYNKSKTISRVHKKNKLGHERKDFCRVSDLVDFYFIHKIGHFWQFCLAIYSLSKMFKNGKFSHL